MRDRCFVVLLVLVCYSTHLCSMEPAKKQNGHKGFIRNTGQLHDQIGADVPDVLFLHHQPGLTVQLRRTGFSYQAWTAQRVIDESPRRKTLGKPISRVHYAAHRVDIELKGAPARVTVIDSTHILYEDAFEHVDLLFVIDEQGRFDFDVILKDGAEPTAIDFAYAGANEVVVDGNMVRIRTAHGVITDRVNGIGSTDGSHESFGLVSAPSIDWVTYYGGLDEDVLFDVKPLGSGRFVVVGATFSSTDIATTGSFQSTYADSSDGFIAVFTADGLPVWSSYLGDIGEEMIYGVDVTSNGEIVAVGYSTSTTGLANGNAFQDVNGGASDGIVARLDQDGGMIWSTYYGGIGDEVFNAIRERPDGSLVVVGTACSDGLALGNSFQAQHAGSCDGFVVIFRDDGQPIEATYIGGSGEDALSAVDVDAVGTIYTAGYSSSLFEISTVGAHQELNAGVSDMIIASLEGAVRKRWATYVGGFGYDVIEGHGLVVGQSGDLFVFGTTHSDSGIATPLSFQPTYTSEFDAALISFDADGNRRWGTYLGADGFDYAGGIWQATDGSILVAGFSDSFSSLASGDAPFPTNSGFEDGYLNIFTTNGDRMFGSYCGGSSSDYVSTVAEIDRGRYIVVGETLSDDVPTSTGAHQGIFGGGSDGFIFSFTACDLRNALTVGPTDVCVGSNVTYTASGTNAVDFTWLKPRLGQIVGNVGQEIIEIAWGSIGTDTVVCVISDARGCADTVRREVIISDSLQPVVLVLGDTIICTGDSTELETEAGFDVYEWFDEDSNMISSDQRVVVRRGGYYSVRVQGGTCSGRSSDVFITEVQPPVVTVTVQGTELVATVDKAESYQWVDEDGAAISGATSERYSPGADGVYSVVITLGPCTVISEPVDFAMVQETELFTVSDVDFGSLPIDAVINANGGHVNEIIVVNVSTQDLQLDSAVVDDPVFNIPHQFPRILRPGDTSRITIRFLPTEEADFIGRVMVFFGSEVGTSIARGSGRQLAPDETITEVVLQPDRIQVEPGETFDIVLSVGLERPTETTATEYEATMQWDSRVLELVSTPEVFFRTTGREDNYYTAKVPEGQRSVGQRELIRIPFRAKLADVDSTVIVFSGATAFRWKDDTKAFAACRDSVVQVVICREGGDRLITKKATATIEGIVPHPVDDVAQVTLRADQDVSVAIELIDPLGVVVLRTDRSVIASGSSSVALPLNGLPSGPYVIRVLDGWRGDSRTIIHR